MTVRLGTCECCVKLVMGGVRRRREDGQDGMEEKSLSPQHSAVKQPTGVAPSLFIAITSF